MKTIDKIGWLIAAILGFVVVIQYNTIRVERGEILYVKAPIGVFPEEAQKVRIDFTHKTIRGDGAYFPVMLWEDQTGTVYAQYQVLYGKVPISCNLLANFEQIVFYRSYFL